jgi:hypothetical protein
LGIARYAKGCGNGLLGEQHPRTAVFEHVGNAISRVIRIQRHIRATRLEHCQQGNQQLLGTRHRHAHAHFRADTQLDQFARETVGLRIEFGVGQLRIGEGHRQRIRGGRHLTSDSLMNAQLGDEIGVDIL